MKTSIIVFSLVLMFCFGHQDHLAAQDRTQEGDKYYLDIHKLQPGTFTYADVAGAHEKDLQTQRKHDVSFITYWVDEKGGYVYCLSKADEASDVHSTHSEAHGLLPQSISEVIAGTQANYTGNGTLFMDIHELGPGKVTAKDVAAAHEKDLKEQGARKVNFINYWVDEKNGRVYCLSEAPNKDAVIATHKHAHGLVPEEVISVKQGQ